MSTLPLDVAMNPATILSRVVFPHPEGPTMLMNRPSVTESEMSLTAVINCPSVPTY
jgi:hypothetical protein